MWTCGIDIATQQATPGDRRAASAARAATRRATRACRARAAARPPVACAVRRRRRSASVSGSIVDEAERRRCRCASGASRCVSIEVLHDRRPDGAGEVVAAGDDRTAMPRRRSNQCEMSASSGPKVAELPRKPISRPCASANCKRLGASPASDVAGAERDACAPMSGTHDAEAVGEPAHQDAAEAEADHGQRVGERRDAAGDAELRLHGRQRDDDRPHADAAERRHRQRRDEAPPGGGAVDDVRGGGGRGGHG